MNSDVSVAAKGNMWLHARDVRLRLCHITGQEVKTKKTPSWCWILEYVACIVYRYIGSHRYAEEEKCKTRVFVCIDVDDQSVF